MNQVETCSSQQLHLSLSRLKTFEKCSSSSSDAIKKKLVKAGFYYNDKDDCVKCFMCNLTLHNLNNDNDDNKTEEDYYIKHHIEKKPDCSFVRNAQQRRIKTFHSIENFYYEKDRLHTFLDWPIPHIINENILAENGFYYLKRKDYCACAFCNKIVGDWRVGDDVAKKHSPRCRFINELPPAGNIPTEHCDILDRYKLRYRGGESSSWEKSMGIETFPKKYNKIEERIKSFINNDYDDDDDVVVAKNLVESEKSHYTSWPADRIKQTPEELAKAGFYYVKVGGDMVKCFYCGGGVYNWEIDDDPIKQHYMYFGHCKFIKSVVEEQNKCLNNEKSSSSSSSSSNQNFDNVVVIDDKDMEILMQSDVCARLKLFYPDNFIRCTLKSRLTKTGAPFFSIRDFHTEYYIHDFRKENVIKIPPQQQQQR